MRKLALLAVFVLSTSVMSAATVGFSAATVHADTPLPGLRVGDVSVIEGDSGKAVVTVPVDLSAPTSATVTVLYTIAGGTATAGPDFLARSSKLTIKAGTANKLISVTVFGDTVIEPDETIAITLSSPMNATLDDANGVVTMIDDDSDSTTGMQVNTGSVTVEEADAGTHYATLPVTLSEPATTTIKVSYTFSCGSALPGDDYKAKVKGTLTFKPGDQYKSIKFAVVADILPEQAVAILNSVTVSLGPAVVHARTSEGEIIDDDGGAGDGSGLPPIGWVARSSVASDGSEAQFSANPLCGGGDYGSWLPSVSADGRYVAFSSDATNLVPNDNNAELDIFVHDRVTGTTEQVDVMSDGSPPPPLSYAQGGAYSPSISADGRFVTFMSYRSLVPAVHDGTAALYVHDRVTGTTELVAMHLDGSPANVGPLSTAPVSADGRYIAFTSGDSNITADNVDAQLGRVYLRDRVLGTTTLVSVGDDGVGAQGNSGMISADGHHVVFQSGAANLVPGDTNGCVDAFVRDLDTSTTELVSVTDDEQPSLPNGDGCGGVSSAESISADGRYVTFTSGSWNLFPGFTAPPAYSYLVGTHVYLRDRVAQTTELVGPDFAWAPGAPVFALGSNVSDDGQHVAYQCICGAYDNNGVVGFYFDRASGDTTIVGELSDGTAPDGSENLFGQAMSADGRFVAFSTDSTNLADDDTNDHFDIYEQRLS